MSRPQRFNNFIDGCFTKPKSSSYFRNTNPCNAEDVIGLFPQSNQSDLNNAAQSAKKALLPWQAIPSPKKALIFFRIADALEASIDSLAMIMTREIGKTLLESRAEIQESIDTARFYAGEGRRLNGITTPSELPNKFCMTLRRPVGVCGLITPWNFPMAVPSWKIFPALILGNTLVWKPAEDAPHSANVFAQIFARAGLPMGVLNIVHGYGNKVGSMLVRHKSISLISFTGSSSTGQIIAENCAKQLKRYSFEMGGKNAQIVMPDANMKLAVDGALWGGFGTSGQRCTATSRVILHQSIYSKFASELIKQTKKLVVGHSDDPLTDLGPLINHNQLKRVIKYVSIGKKEGAKLLLGGSRLTQKPYSAGFFFQPTIFGNVDPNSRIAQEEIFGPVIALIKVSGLEEAIQIANNTRYGLSSSIYSKDINRNMKAIHSLEAGITYINSPSIGAEVHLPFGGVKNTGTGHRESGVQALDIFSEWKTIYVDYSSSLQKAQID